MRMAHWKGYDVEILEEDGDLTLIRYSPNRYTYFNEWVKTSELI